MAHTPLINYSGVGSPQRENELLEDDLSDEDFVPEIDLDLELNLDEAVATRTRAKVSLADVDIEELEASLEVPLEEEDAREQYQAFLDMLAQSNVEANQATTDNIKAAPDGDLLEDDSDDEFVPDRDSSDDEDEIQEIRISNKEKRMLRREAKSALPSGLSRRVGGNLTTRSQLKEARKEQNQRRIQRQNRYLEQSSSNIFHELSNFRGDLNKVSIGTEKRRSFPGLTRAMAGVLDANLMTPDQTEQLLTFLSDMSNRTASFSLHPSSPLSSSSSSSTLPLSSSAAAASSSSSTMSSEHNLETELSSPLAGNVSISDTVSPINTPVNDLPISETERMMLKDQLNKHVQLLIQSYVLGFHLRAATKDSRDGVSLMNSSRDLLLELSCFQDIAETSSRFRLKIASQKNLYPSENFTQTTNDLNQASTQEQLGNTNGEAFRLEDSCTATNGNMLKDHINPDPHRIEFPSFDDIIPHELRTRLYPSSLSGLKTAYLHGNSSVFAQIPLLNKWKYCLKQPQFLFMFDLNQPADKISSNDALLLEVFSRKTKANSSTNDCNHVVHQLGESCSKLYKMSLRTMGAKMQWTPVERALLVYGEQYLISRLKIERCQFERKHWEAISKRHLPAKSVDQCIQMSKTHRFLHCYPSVSAELSRICIARYLCCLAHKGTLDPHQIPIFAFDMRFHMPYLTSRFKRDRLTMDMTALTKPTSNESRFYFTAQDKSLLHSLVRIHGRSWKKIKEIGFPRIKHPRQLAYAYKLFFTQKPKMGLRKGRRWPNEGDDDGSNDDDGDNDDDVDEEIDYHIDPQEFEIEQVDSEFSQNSQEEEDTEDSFGEDSDEDSNEGDSDSDEDSDEDGEFVLSSDADVSVSTSSSEEDDEDISYSIDQIKDTGFVSEDISKETDDTDEREKDHDEDEDLELEYQSAQTFEVENLGEGTTSQVILIENMDNMGDLSAPDSSASLSKPKRKEVKKKSNRRKADNDRLYQEFKRQAHQRWLDNIHEQYKRRQQQDTNISPSSSSPFLSTRLSESSSASEASVAEVVANSGVDLTAVVLEDKQATQTSNTCPLGSEFCTKNKGKSRRLQDLCECERWYCSNQFCTTFLRKTWLKRISAHRGSCAFKSKPNSGDPRLGISTAHVNVFDSILKTFQGQPITISHLMKTLEDPNFRRLASTFMNNHFSQPRPTTRTGANQAKQANGVHRASSQNETKATGSMDSRKRKVPSTVSEPNDLSSSSSSSPISSDSVSSHPNTFPTSKRLRTTTNEYDCSI